MQCDASRSLVADAISLPNLETTDFPLVYVAPSPRALVPCPLALCGNFLMLALLRVRYAMYSCTPSSSSYPRLILLALGLECMVRRGILALA